MSTSQTSILWALPLLASPLLSIAAPPSDESLLSLFRLTKAEAQVEETRAQLEQQLQKAMAQASKGKPMTEDQEAVVKAAPRRFAAVMGEFLNWQKLQPIQMGVYRDAFDQEEIDGLIAFYSSPIGQRVVDKIPRATQSVAVAMQQTLLAVVPRLQEEVRNILVEAKLAE